MKLELNIEKFISLPPTHTLFFGIFLPIKHPHILNFSLFGPWTWPNSEEQTNPHLSDIAENKIKICLSYIAKICLSIRLFSDNMGG